MLADQFSQAFREEHRQVRDVLLDLMVAFSSRDLSRTQALLERTAQLTGPHFRFEEESLYPALTQIFGTEYIEKLLQDHDQAIGVARKLVELASQGPLSHEETQRAVTLIRGVLPHVSDCDGLSIMVERLPETTVQAILEARERSNHAGLDLMQWATQVRERPMASVT